MNETKSEYYTIEKWEANSTPTGSFYEVEGWRDDSLENTKKDFLKGTTVGNLGDPTIYRIVKVTHEVIE